MTKAITPAYRSGSAPGALPLLGHSALLFRRPLDFLSSLPAHGDLVEIRLGRKPAYVVCDPAMLEQILLKPRIFDKGGPLFEKARLLAGNGLTTCDWSEHRRQRPMLQPAFHSRRLTGYIDTMQQEINNLTGSWRPGQTIDITEHMHTLTVRVSARALLSIAAENDAVTEIQRSLPIVMRGIYTRTITPLEILGKLPTPGNRRFNRALANLRTVINSLIERYRNNQNDEHCADDLLSILLAHQGPDGQGVSQQEIHDQVTTILLAGETTAYPLAWIFYLLNRNPAIEQRLYDEVRGVLGGRTPTFEDIAELRYPYRVITEALRLYPPGWLFSRVTTTETELAGRKLPAGTAILFSAYLLQHRPDLFPSPETFDPDRWLPERAATIPSGAMVPFGTGNRKCIGDTFAMNLATLTLSTIVQRWQLRLKDDGEVRPAPKASLGSGPLLMTVHSRDSH